MVTEYNGEDSPDSTVQPKGTKALGAHEKLRLIYLTGQANDPRVGRDAGESFRGETR